ncbi:MULTISPECIES: putative toxin-antitoxin system toxin component, PIN family [Undibacterium]|jgi:putative PIN family toxin of toxin-antitoxin system|uniref:Toxin-antitoxin system toxin component, PIN family n=1 Tax=Undibacterium aquatile TaxID=1537398 RepID=A0ABR6XCX7_9BURK|nr:MULTISPECIES: putative toxin-antitoxin system toxin component, PIN family [Undibacterium]MBC3810770.1 putative toxin-antitoxin system toxin component, PIN family [Undibacterium aquatile]MBC3879007.1 putative toxin-antitoxin system toxin component, PIN family [Undibacterium sp. FT79W]
MTAIIPKHIVIDTNVCLDLFVFNDPRWLDILHGLKNGQLKAITRTDCREEWLAVLKYPHLPVTQDKLPNICQQFDLLIECVAPPLNADIRLPICSDKDDQKFLEIARDSSATTLITKDKALLKLARKIRKAGLFSVETPEQFLIAWTQENSKTNDNQVKQ